MIPFRRLKCMFIIKNKSNLTGYVGHVVCVCMGRQDHTLPTYFSCEVTNYTSSNRLSCKQSQQSHPNHGIHNMYFWTACAPTGPAVKTSPTLMSRGF